VRKWSDAVDNGANLLIPVPGGGDGPGGVLVAAENFLLYRHQVGTRPYRCTAFLLSPCHPPPMGRAAG
jgi:hypothetical protein